MLNLPKIFLFKIAGISFGLPIDEVVEVIRPKEVIPDRKPKPFILGTIVSREKQIYLFDLPAYLGFERSTSKMNTIISRVKDLTIGFLVDQFLGVAPAPEEISPLPEDIFKGVKLAGVATIQNELIQIMSFKNLITPSRLTALRKSLG